MFVIKLSKLWSENFHCFCCCYCRFCSSTVPASFGGVILPWKRAKVLANLTSLYFLILLLFRLIRGFPFRTCNVLLLRIYIKLLWHKVSIEQASSGERKVLETMQKHFPGQLVAIEKFLVTTLLTCWLALALFGALKSSRKKCCWDSLKVMCFFSDSWKDYKCSWF